MKRIILITCVIFTIATGMAACSPPQKITFEDTFHGVQLSAGGTVLEECDINLKYTIQDDECTFLEFSLPNYHCDTSDYETTIPLIKNQDQGYEMISILEYNSESNAYSDQIQIFLSTDRDWYLISIKSGDTQAEQIYIATKDSDLDIQEIIATVYPE